MSCVNRYVARGWQIIMGWSKGKKCGLRSLGVTEKEAKVSMSLELERRGMGGYKDGIPTQASGMVFCGAHVARGWKRGERWMD